MSTTATAPALTIQDAVAFIRDHADGLDLATISDAIKARHTALRRTAAATLQVGTPATLAGLSPKYLNGLTGTVAEVGNGRGALLLDEKSTRELRYLGARRIDIPQDQERYTLTGLPLSTIVPTPADD